MYKHTLLSIQCIANNWPRSLIWGVLCKLHQFLFDTGDQTKDSTPSFIPCPDLQHKQPQNLLIRAVYLLLKTGSHCVALADLELVMSTRLVEALNS